MSHMKCQVLFSLNNKNKKKIKVLSAAAVIGTLSVKLFVWTLTCLLNLSCLLSDCFEDLIRSFPYQENCFVILRLSALGKIFSRQHIEIFFCIFPRKQDLTFHAKETVCMKCHFLFCRKIRKKIFQNVFC